MQIITKRLILRPISMEDRMEIFTSFDDEITTYMYPKPAKEIIETEAFILQSIENYKNKKEIIFVARLKETNEFIGCMGLHQMDSITPELGLWIKKEVHHHGYGLEGIKGIILYTKNHISYQYLIYPVDKRNLASRNIPESLGGIPVKSYQKINQKQVELQIVEYFIFKEIPKNLVKPVLLFQGDSITDANRYDSKNQLGFGYVNILSGHMPLATIINRGISGNRVTELLERWEEDTIQLKPQLISILVGINEVWHNYTWNKPMTPEQFEENYKNLLIKTKKECEHAYILLIEPFVYPIGAHDPSWERDLKEEQRIVKKLAHTYADEFIPMQSILDQYKENYQMDEILGDGVHPTLLGHQIIEKEVRKVVRNFLLKWYLDHPYQLKSRN